MIVVFSVKNAKKSALSLPIQVTINLKLVLPKYPVSSVYVVPTVLRIAPRKPFRLVIDQKILRRYRCPEDIASMDGVATEQKT